MPNPEAITHPTFQHLYTTGVALRERILTFLSSWPHNPEGYELWLEMTDEGHQETARTLAINVRRWFSEVSQQVLPVVLWDRMTLYYTSRQLEAAVRKHR